MQVDGSNTIHAPRARVWELLNDPEVLARCVPGVQDMTPDGENKYKATLAVAVGPVRGNFKANVELLDLTPPETMTLRIEAKSPTGIVKATGKLTLVEEGPDITRVDWTGEPQLMGMLATLAGRLIGGISKQQADVFFKNVEGEAARGASPA